jgi:hypothetical protein
MGGEKRWKPAPVSHNLSIVERSAGARGLATGKRQQEILGLR